MVQIEASDGSLTHPLFKWRGVSAILYKFRDLAVEELEKVNRIYPDMQVSTATFTFSDSTQKDLLKITGVIPVKYEGKPRLL
uniref:UEV domain-containing protein n=1 Tax=Oryzias sinensis TaxID=183150 RepID=A0A8C7YD33_9TELE